MRKAAHIAASLLMVLASTSAGLSVSVTPAGKNVFRVDIDPAESTNSAIQLKLAGKVFWTGQVHPLSSYGRAQVPGIEITWPASNEAIYGLGQRFNSLNQSGKKCEMWIRDEPGQSGGGASYFCTPVLFSTRGYALFAADNPEGDFDFNSSGDGQNRYRRAGQTAREPWNFGEEAEAAYKLLANLRMKLKPTLIALGKEAARTGMPIMRPMIFEFPDDHRFLDEDSQFMLGPDLLVAPILEEGAMKRTVKFPKGTWVHLLDKRTFEGPSDTEVEIGLKSVPVFVRKGATFQELGVQGPKSAS